MHTRVIWTLLVILSLVGPSLVHVSPAHAQTPTATDPASRASAAAVEISQFEAQGNIDQLYARMHLDAKVLIPKEAVAGWYQADFFPRGPGVITVTGVQIISWTWDVTGITYPTTAEVSFTQPFANGETVSEVVRLVEDNGVWYWFFGRNRDFVNQQITTYAAGYPLIDDTSAASSQVTNDVAPWGLESFSAFSVDPNTFMATLPPAILTHEIGEVEATTGGSPVVPPFAGQMLTAPYFTPPELTIPSGQVSVYTLNPDVTTLDALTQIENSWRESPQFAILRQHRDPSADVPFMLIQGTANDADGVVPVLYWCNPDGTEIYAASMRDYVSLRLLVTQIVNPTQPAAVPTQPVESTPPIEPTAPAGG
ncbi:MAG TPA: hypothetical protein VM450_02440 [Thermomicrobiales bacterium]|nr:hypothetical protein [Thermomicrobiales bacterium]